VIAGHPGPKVIEEKKKGIVAIERNAASKSPKRLIGSVTGGTKDIKPQDALVRKKEK